MIESVRAMGEALERRGWYATGTIEQMVAKQSTYFKAKRVDPTVTEPVIDTPQVLAAVGRDDA